MDFNSLNKIKVGVIGDLILDHFVFGKVERISPEAPVPIVRVTKEMSFLGGASNVARNLRSIDVKTYLFGVVGRDIQGNQLEEMIRNEGILTDNIITDKNRPTTVKTRIIAHSQQVVRFDKEKILSIENGIIDKIIKKVKELSLDAIIISDYGKGVISKELIERLTDISNLFISVDPKVNNAEYYKGVHIITPNLKEAEQISKIEIEKFENGVELAAKKIMEQSNTQYVLITQGEDGMALFFKNGDIYHQKAKAKEVYDVTGAGDTVIAVLTAFMAAGVDIKQCVKIANIAAGIVVGKVGTATVTLDELNKEIFG